nr:hypothetical protein [Delftia acidovorans]
MHKRFAPEEFFEAAKLLQQHASKGDDGYLRSSISRYYYAALISARDKFGISTRGGMSHQKVLDFYADKMGVKSDPNAAFYKAVRDNLLKLKTLREKADYQSDTTCKTSECNCSRSLSEQVLEELKRFGS